MNFFRPWCLLRNSICLTSRKITESKNYTFIRSSSRHTIQSLSSAVDVTDIRRSCTLSGCTISQWITTVTVAEAELFWLDKFDQADIPEPVISIRLILASVLGLRNVANLDSDRVRKQILSPEECALLHSFAALRLRRMPVQYIIGEWEFEELCLKMSHSPPVFIPRPETEGLVTMASSFVSCPTTRCLEIGCGTGAVTLALLNRHKRLQCCCIDADPAAVSLARENAQILGLSDRAVFAVGRLTDKDGIQGKLPFELSRRFDIVVSNPPYIPTAELSFLAPEIKQYEPRLALDGGEDGTSIIRMILLHAPQWLRSGGTVVLEVDPRQLQAIEQISKETGCYAGPLQTEQDSFRVERFVALTTK